MKPDHCSRSARGASMRLRKCPAQIPIRPRQRTSGKMARFTLFQLLKWIGKMKNPPGKLPAGS
jgi:hypothetical protein